MSAQLIYDFVEDDTLPEPAYQFEDLLPYSFIHFDVVREDGFELPRKTYDVVTPGNSINAELADPVLNIIRFTWNTGELIKGHHTARIVLVRASDSKEESLPKELPILLRVADRVKG